MSKAIDAVLHQMHLPGKPRHDEKVYGQQNRRHPKPGYWHYKVLSIKLPEFVFVHGVGPNVGNHTRGCTKKIRRSIRQKICHHGYG